MRAIVFLSFIIVASCGRGGPVEPLDSGEPQANWTPKREDVYCRKGGLQWQPATSSASARASCDAPEHIPLSGSCSGNNHPDASLRFDGPEEWESSNPAGWLCLWAARDGVDMPNNPAAEAHICCLKTNAQ